jgi:antitoxin HicB
MLYPVNLRPEPEGSISVSFPDIPEALTSGTDEADALRHALDALLTALDFYFDAKEPVPLPSKPARGQLCVELPASYAATVLLYNEVLRQRVRPAELAKRLGIPRQDMTRMLKPRHNTKIDSVASALAALGKHLELKVA